MPKIGSLAICSESFFLNDKGQYDVSLDYGVQLEENLNLELTLLILIIIIHMRGDHAKYDLDQAKIFLHIRRGLRHKIEQF